MPAFNLQDFKSAVTDNQLLRPNLFRVRVFYPQALNALGGPADHFTGIDLELWGEAAFLPGVALTTKDAQRWGYGSVEKRPYMLNYQPWDVTFRMDGSGMIWRLFKEWNNMIINVNQALDAGSSAPAGRAVSKYEIAYKNTYLVDTEVTVFTPDGAAAISATMVEAFPYQLNKIPLDWSPATEYSRFTVSFTFTDWQETNSSPTTPIYKLYSNNYRRLIEMEKYGFVYIWRDRKRKMYYIGSHLGKEDDGYICSSKWMKQAYKHRPEDFKRRILERMATTHKILLEREEAWLQQILPTEIKTKYYNLKRHVNHWIKDDQKALTVREKIAATLTGKKHTKERRRNQSLAHLGYHPTEETRAKLRLRKNHCISHTEESKEKNRLAHLGVKRGSYKPRSINEKL